MIIKLKQKTKSDQCYLRKQQERVHNRLCPRSNLCKIVTDKMDRNHGGNRDENLIHDNRYVVTGDENRHD